MAASPSMPVTQLKPSHGPALVDNFPSSNISTVLYQYVSSFFIGCLLDVFFQAILYSLAFPYLTRNWKTDRNLRWIVLALVVITSVKTVETFYITWKITITYNGNPMGALAFQHSNWAALGNPIIVAFICLYVQSFFAYRLWVLSRQWILVVTILSLSVLSVIAAGMAIGQFLSLSGSKLQMWLQIHFSAVFASDVLLTTSLLVLLVRAKKDVSPYTVGILTALLRLVFLSALPATLCTLVNLVFAVWKTNSSYIAAVNQPLPKLFAISMLWTLNARDSLKEKVFNRNDETYEVRELSKIEFGKQESELESANEESSGH